jgi:hypothetical protein
MNGIGGAVCAVVMCAAWLLTEGDALMWSADAEIRRDPGRVVQVRTGEELARALEVAQPGDRIVLAAGEYHESEFEIGLNGKPGQPIVIRAGQLLTARITGGVRITGSYVTVYGLLFDGPESGLVVGGMENRVLRCRFTDWRGNAVTPIVGRGVEIAYCEFARPHAWLESDQGGYPLRIGIRPSHRSVDDYHYDAYIHHNYFHAFPEKPDPSQYHSGQSDAIEIGQTARGVNIPSGWLVEYNLIEDHCQGHGIIDIKTGANTIRFNTLVNCPGGRIDARTGGTGNIIASNWMENTGGISVLGGYHTVTWNRLIGGGRIAVLAGNIEWDSFSSNRYPRAYRTEVLGNEGELVIGHAYQDDMLPAAHTFVAGHRGSISCRNEVETVLSPTAPEGVAKPVRLTQEEVGPEAPAASREDWGESPEGLPEPLRVVPVTTAGEFAAALADARAGDHIVLAGGEYGSESDFGLSAAGTEDKPVVVRAARKLGARLITRLWLLGDYNIAWGLDVHGPGMGIGGHSNRITRCRLYFDGRTGECVYVVKGERGRLDHCDLSVRKDDIEDPNFKLPPTWSMMRTGINYGMKSAEDAHYDLRVDHNYFHDFPDPTLADRDYHEVAPTAVRVGYGLPEVSPRIVVEHNLFERCGCDSVINLKSSENTARSNTILDSRGHITVRLGRLSTLAGNWLEDSGGVRVMGDGHRVLGNYVRRCAMGIAIMAGDATDYGEGSQPRAANVFVAGNDSDRLTIGYRWPNHTYPAIGTRVEAHTGPIARDLEEATTISPSATESIPQPVRVTRAEAGLYADPERGN